MGGEICPKIEFNSNLPTTSHGRVLYLEKHFGCSLPYSD